MSAKTRTDERLEELSDRIGQLEAKAQASGAEAKESMKEHAEEVDERLAHLDKRAEAAVAEQRLDELPEASGERLREEKTAATRERAALDRKVDEALKKSE